MSDEENTMFVWNAVCKTDPAFTKRSEQKGGFTSINPYYQIQEATRLWGPYGNRWGLNKININYHQELGFVLLEAQFFCPETTFVINNAVEPISQKGRRDVDFLKKLETDTLTKALSRLGFNADVFMSQFDDERYVQERAAEAELQRADDKEAILNRKYAEIRAGVEHAIQTMNNCPTLAAVNVIKDKTLMKARRELNAYQFRPDQFDSVVINAANKRMSELQQGAE